CCYAIIKYLSSYNGCVLFTAPSTPDTNTLSLHDALPIYLRDGAKTQACAGDAEVRGPRARADLRAECGALLQGHDCGSAVAAGGLRQRLKARRRARRARTIL